VPVRVALDAGELAEHPLRVGLSMTATVDVRDRSGPAVAGSPQGSQPASVTTVYDALDTAADERVDAIVSRNLGRNVHLRRAR
jgi:membrane fusion protein (multidrug efflux system)